MFVYPQKIGRAASACNAASSFGNDSVSPPGNSREFKNFQSPSAVQQMALDMRQTAFYTFAVTYGLH
jgi:hypothetical protein